MKNIGNVERVIRLVLGVGLLSLVWIGPKTAWGYVGLIPLLTGFISFCPLWKILGINTCKKGG